jgi:CheY-like chemotaxis protein
MKTGPILIIDDDEGIREILQLILEDEGYKTFTSNDGAQALELLRKIPEPSLILLDLMMPIMDGREFMLELRQDPDLGHLNTPIILITAFSNVKITGVTGVTQKPLEMNEVLAIARKYCSLQNRGENVSSHP